MKVKRSLFVITLIALFTACFYIMNQHYDELARYPHELSESQRELVLSHFNTEEINYLVSQKIEPQQFLPFIEVEGFELNNTLWYNIAYETQKPAKEDKDEKNKEFIVSFINRYRDQMEYGQLSDLLSNYSYNVLTRFFDEGDPYIDKARLIPTPAEDLIMMKNRQTIYTYEPKNLVTLNDLPHESIISGANDITIRKEVVKPLHQLCQAAREINQKTCGDMRIVAGYISYEDEIALYEKAKSAHGKDATSYWDYPGQSEFQLGYSVQLLPNEVSLSDDSDTAKNSKEKTPTEEEREQEIWLKDNAYKYGFIIRYPKQKEDVTGKKYQPYTLRYVGVELAKYIHDENLALEEVNLDDFKK